MPGSARCRLCGWGKTDWEDADPVGGIKLRLFRNIVEQRIAEHIAEHIGKYHQLSWLGMTWHILEPLRDLGRFWKQHLLFSWSAAPRENDSEFGAQDEYLRDLRNLHISCTSLVVPVLQSNCRGLRNFPGCKQVDLLFTWASKINATTHLQTAITSQALHNLDPLSVSSFTMLHYASLCFTMLHYASLCFTCFTSSLSFQLLLMLGWR